MLETFFIPGKRLNELSDLSLALMGSMSVKSYNFFYEKRFQWNFYGKLVSEVDSIITGDSELLRKFKQRPES